MKKIEAFAKINLTLEVLGRRADGYHDLKSVVLPISLSDTIEITDARELSCNTNFENDLCLVAARALQKAVPHAAKCGAKIRVEKRIPTGGGLGGGSADAAATLVALNELWSCALSVDELVSLAAQVGSDVPALVLARFVGPVLMEGRGERVSPFFTTDEIAKNKIAKNSFHLVLANPGVFCSTPEIFREFSRAKKFREISRANFAEIKFAMTSGDLSLLAKNEINDLEESACALHREIIFAKNELTQAGARGVMMSGSGSTVFGFVASRDEAENLAKNLATRNLHVWSATTDI